MKKRVIIIWESAQTAWVELFSNRLRSFLSLLGITFGIFCIAGISATVRSLKIAINNELKAIGNHIIYVQKYPSGQGEGYPWWRYIRRPEVRYTEMKLLKEKMPVAKNIAMMLYLNGIVEHEGNTYSGVNYYGITDKFNAIETVPVSEGRYFLPDNFDNASNFIVLGHTIASDLFGDPLKALNSKVLLRGRYEAIVIGLLEKQGKSLLNAFDYDHCLLMTYSFMRRMTKEELASPVIMLQGEDYMATTILRDEVRGAMRSIRKLKPDEDDNFALNDIEGFAHVLDTVFAQVEIGGWAIALLSLFVGMFGVANIMFVSVRERTRYIGLKKAMGARPSLIVFEFLLEAVLLSILGGSLGLALVLALARGFSSTLQFRIYVGGDVMALAFAICFIVGVLSGAIPALRAARMDPAVALRS